MSLLKFTSFGGVVPRLAKRDIPDDKAQVAHNLDPSTTEFKPLKDHGSPVNVALLDTSPTIRTLFQYPMRVGGTLYATGLKMSVVRSTIASDTKNRAYGSALHGEENFFPVVWVTDGTSNPGLPNTSMRPLGVKPPTKPLTTVKSLDNTSILFAETAEAFRNAIPATVKNILLTIRDTAWQGGYHTIPAWFQTNSVAPDSGVYQRFWYAYDYGVVEPSGMTMPDWLLELPYYREDSLSRNVYYYDYQGAAKYFKITTDVPRLDAARAALLAIKKPLTNIPVFTSEHVTKIFDAISLFFTDPATTQIPGVKTALDKYKVSSDNLVAILSFGGGGAGSRGGFDSQRDKVLADATEITRLYEDAWGALLDHALTEFVNADIAPNLPRGEIPEYVPRIYTYTFVNDMGEESRPYYPADADSDAILEVNQAEKVTVSLPAAPFADIAGSELFKYEKWRIYRSSPGSTNTEFMFLVELPLTTTTYEDSVKDEQLNEAIATKEWEPPPVVGGKNLCHLVSMPGGFLAGFIDNTVYFSEPYATYAWPVAYSVPLRSNIVALGVFGVTLVALTESGPVYISGNGPDAMSAVVLESQEVCQSPRSVTAVTGGVLFASQNGLCLATQGGVQVLTLPLMPLSDWRNVAPKEVVCEEYNGVVYMSAKEWANVGLFALHVPTMNLTSMLTPVTAMYSDIASGDLYFAHYDFGPVCSKMFAGSGYMDAKWRSKRIVLEKETGFSWMRVEGEQTPTNGCAIDIWGYYINAEGVEVAEKVRTEKATFSGGVMTSSANATDTRPFRVGTGRYKDYEIEIRGKCRITSVMLASSTAELQGVN